MLWNQRTFNVKKMRHRVHTFWVRFGHCVTVDGVWWLQQKSVNRKHIAGGITTKCVSLSFINSSNGNDDDVDGDGDDDRSTLSPTLAFRTRTCDSSLNMDIFQFFLISLHLLFPKILFVSLIAAFIFVTSCVFPLVPICSPHHESVRCVREPRQRQLVSAPFHSLWCVPLLVSGALCGAFLFRHFRVVWSRKKERESEKERRNVWHKFAIYASHMRNHGRLHMCLECDEHVCEWVDCVCENKLRTWTTITTFACCVRPSVPFSLLW